LQAEAAAKQAKKLADKGKGKSGVAIAGYEHGRV